MSHEDNEGTAEKAKEHDHQETFGVLISDTNKLKNQMEKTL